MSGGVLGVGLLGLAELGRKDRQLRQERGQLRQEREDYNQLHDEHTDFVFRAKSHVHGLRALVHAHCVTEDELIAALKLENANHPLASREAVDAVVMEKRIAALVDPEVIKRTYPDGVLPEGLVIPPDKSNVIA